MITAVYVPALLINLIVLLVLAVLMVKPPFLR